MKIAILCDVTPGSRLRFHRFSEELGASPISVGGKKKHVQSMTVLLKM